MRYPALGARERRARAGVDAVPEREMLATVRPVEAELVRALERARDRDWRRPGAP